MIEHCPWIVLPFDSKTSTTIQVRQPWSFWTNTPQTSQSSRCELLQSFVSIKFWNPPRIRTRCAPDKRLRCWWCQTDSFVSTCRANPKTMAYSWFHRSRTCSPLQGWLVGYPFGQIVAIGGICNRSCSLIVFNRCWIVRIDRSRRYCRGVKAVTKSHAYVFGDPKSWGWLVFCFLCNRYRFLQNLLLNGIFVFNRHVHSLWHSKIAISSRIHSFLMTSIRYYVVEECGPENISIICSFFGVTVQSSVSCFFCCWVVVELVLPANFWCVLTQENPLTTEFRAKHSKTLSNALRSQ